MLSIRATVACVSMMSATVSSAASMIDNFSVGPIALIRDAGVPVMLAQSGLDTAHVIGGGRKFLLGEFGSDGQSATIDTMIGQLTLGVNAPATLAYLSLSYGSDAQPLNFDLTADGSDRFALDFASIAGSASLRLTSPGKSQVSRVIGETISYSKFAPVDITNVSSITLLTPRSGGFVLNSIQTVPEPFTGALLAVGILCMLTASRR